MTSREFRERLTRRLRRANVVVEPATLEALDVYFRLLDRWNTKINLTALPLHVPADETFDRLFVEPLAAARYVPNTADVWIDLGSGGGSPAIPLKIVRTSLRLTMVESKAKKAAFLREAVRALRLVGATVENVRFEALPRQAAALVTVRAVKADRHLFAAAADLLSPDGRLLLFRPTPLLVSASGFEPVETAQLSDPPRAFLAIYRRVFHGE